RAGVVQLCWMAGLTQRSEAQACVTPRRSCSPRGVTAMTSGRPGASCGRLLDWKTTTGQWRGWAMPMAMLSGHGEELRRILLENGFTNIPTRPAPVSYTPPTPPTNQTVCTPRFSPSFRKNNN
ncbi:DUF927 domain-containing protein, partial [Salmonella enterica]|uniref:DUF927 domain-containing protein n=1 Tax=Salmonella enterica TaxID=28901 RepID=UPI00398C7130